MILETSIVMFISPLWPYTYFYTKSVRTFILFRGFMYTQHTYRSNFLKTKKVYEQEIFEILSRLDHFQFFFRGQYVKKYILRWSIVLYNLQPNIICVGQHSTNI